MKQFIFLLLSLFCFTALSAQPGRVKLKGKLPLQLQQPDDGLVRRMLIGESSSRLVLVDGWMGDFGDFHYSNPYDLTDLLAKIKTDNDESFQFRHYRKGKLSNGQVIDYYETTGRKFQPAFKGNFKQGLLNGKAWFYFTEEDRVDEPKRVKATGQFENGELVGDWLQYDINGNLSLRVVYRKNREVADSMIEYQDDGSIKSLTAFLPNRKYKFTKEFYPGGQLFSEEILTGVNGEDHFYDYTEYYENGSIKQKGKYKAWGVHREKTGTWEEFEPDGRPKQQNPG